MTATIVSQARTGSSVAKPTGLLDGHMVVVAINHLGSAPAISGFTQLINQANGGGGQTTNLTVLYKKNVTAASEPANYTITGGSGTLDVTISRVAGYDLTTPWGTPVGAGYSGAGSTLTSPTYTPGTADELLVRFYAVWVDSAGFTASTGHTLLVSRVEGDPALIEYKALSGQSGVSQGTGSITGAGSQQCAAATVGIIAAAGGPTTVNATASMAGAGSLTASKSVTRNKTASLAGTSTLAAAKAVTRPRTASMAGVSALAADRTKTLNRTASLGGSSGLTATATVTPGGGTVSRNGSLAGVGALSATKAVLRPRTGSLGGTGGLTASRTKTLNRTASLGGVSTLTATATVTPGGGTKSRTASMGGSSTLTATARCTRARTAGAVSSSSLSAVVNVTRRRSGTISGTSTLTAESPLPSLGTILIRAKPPLLRPPARARLYPLPPPRKASVRLRAPRSRWS